MGFEDDVARFLADSAEHDRSGRDRQAAEVAHFVKDYEAALGEARAYLTTHLAPTRVLLEKRLFKNDRYSPDGYVLYRSRSSTGGPGIHVPSSWFEANVDMLLTTGEVWSNTLGRSRFGYAYDPLNDLLAGHIRTHIFGLDVESGFDVMTGVGGATARPSDDWDAPRKPFREYLIQLCAAAHETHESR
jgi:hypothetical protein